MRFTDRGFRWEQVATTTNPGGAFGLMTVVISAACVVVVIAFVTVWLVPVAAFLLAPVVSAVAVGVLWLLRMSTWRPEPGGVELDGRTVRIREHDLLFELDLDALVIDVDEEKRRLGLSDGGEVFPVFPGDDFAWLASALRTARERWSEERGGGIPEPEQRALNALRAGRERG